MSEAVHTAERLKELQALPLERKIQISQARIIEWYQRWNGNVVVSFSGGKDSTVLLHLVRTIYPDVRAVFSNTGLEYGEIQRFVQSFPNVDIVTPKMRFDQVISSYGYPLIGKEVAEAIYYARRLRSQSVHVEREREQGRTVLHHRRELLGLRISGGGYWKPYLDERSGQQTDDPSRQVERYPGSGTNSPDRGNGSTRWATEPKRGGRRPTGAATICTDAGRQRDFKRTELSGIRSAARGRGTIGASERGNDGTCPGGIEPG